VPKRRKKLTTESAESTDRELKTEMAPDLKLVAKCINGKINSESTSDYENW